MKEFKGASGSWKYEAKLGEVVAEGGVIAEVIVNESEDENGMLMASAPDLLSVLQEALNAHILPEYHADKAKAAIDKALGKSQ